MYSYIIEFVDNINGTDGIYDAISGLDDENAIFATIHLAQKVDEEAGRDITYTVRKYQNSKEHPDIWTYMGFIQEEK